MIDVMEIDIDRPEKVVYVVGLGPGEPFYMTQQAANTLESVDAICGYKVYLDLIRDEFPCEEYYSTGMTQEIDRCRWALEKARTGSVSVELALAAPAGQVYAVECDPEACKLIQKNREKFAAYNLTLIEGKAPEALDTLPAPDAVFIGGTKGNMGAVIDAVLHKNSVARLCIAAIALETLSAAVAALTAHGLAAEVTQIAVSRTKTAGSLHLLMANNPVFLITGART